MRKAAVAICLVLAALVPVATANSQQSQTGTQKCNHKCQFARDRAKLRKATPHNPIPSYIVACESGGNYHALNPTTQAGGKYQILPSTWSAYLSRLRHYIVRLAGGNAGPQNSSHLLQDKIALMIWKDSGSSQWSCG